MNSPPAPRRTLEAHIAAAEAELRAAETRLNDSATFHDVETGAAAGRAVERLAATVAGLYERWEAGGE